MADNKEKDKKQLLLRLSPTLWESLAEWAEDDFRSINGQIEYLLSESVKKRKRDKKKESQTTGIPD
jgi:hypothetical protein